MKLSIEKLPNGNVKVKLQTSPSSKAIDAELPPDKIESLIRVLGLALKADVFSFSLVM